MSTHTPHLSEDRGESQNGIEPRSSSSSIPHHYAKPTRVSFYQHLNSPAPSSFSSSTTSPLEYEQTGLCFRTLAVNFGSGPQPFEERGERPKWNRTEVLLLLHSSPLRQTDVSIILSTPQLTCSFFFLLLGHLPSEYEQTGLCFRTRAVNFGSGPQLFEERGERPKWNRTEVLPASLHGQTDSRRGESQNGIEPRSCTPHHPGQTDSSIIPSAPQLTCSYFFLLLHQTIYLHNT